MGKCCPHASSFIFDRIIIRVAGNQDRHKSSDEFDFGPDQATHFGVTCPWMTKIIHFRTYIYMWPVGQSWFNFMCSITGGGERLFWGRLEQNPGVHGNRKPHWLIIGKMVSPPFLACFWSDSFILVSNKDLHKISDEFEIGPQTTELVALERLKISHRLIMGK